MKAFSTRTLSIRLKDLEKSGILERQTEIDLLNLFLLI
jgi:DNA-binding HxlR family transcriptional regulator